MTHKEAIVEGFVRRTPKRLCRYLPGTILELVVRVVAETRHLCVLRFPKKRNWFDCSGLRRFGSHHSGKSFSQPTQLPYIVYLRMG